MSVLKESDTLYTCRNYNIYGPMISWESYKDAGLEIPHGAFKWYNAEGKVDSAATYANGQKVSFVNNRAITVKPVIPPAEINDTVTSKQKIDSVDQHPAEFKGGVKSMDCLSGKKYKTPDRLMNLTTNSMQYVVVASFYVHTNGEITNIMIEKTCEWSADNEIIRVLKNSPKWKPATQNARPVIYRHIQSFTFSVTNR
jgi:hypothetical protein